MKAFLVEQIADKEFISGVKEVSIPKSGQRRN